MRQATTSYLIECDVESFWRIYLDDGYAKKLYLEGLGFPRIEVLDRGETTRRMRIVPKLGLPRPVMKLLGDHFAYEEHGTLDRAANEWRWRLVPSVLQDKVTIEGSVRIEPAAEGSCRRSDSVTVEARIFGLGSIIESSVEAEVKAGWAKESALLRDGLVGFAPVEAATLP